MPARARQPPSTFFGGDGHDVLTGVAVDAGGRIYVAGYTTDEADFTTAIGAVVGGDDIVVAQINPGGAGAGDLLYVDLHGGSNDDHAHAVAFSSGKLYIVGDTKSSALATPGAYQAAYPAGDPYAALAAIYTFTAAPVLAGPSSVSYVENDLSLVINSTLVVSDSDSATLSSGAVTLSNFVAGQDMLSFTNDGSTMGNIAASFDGTSGILSLTSAGATATIAQWQAALRAVRYSNSSENPNVTTRNVAFSVNDGSSTSNVVASTVAVSAVNDAPVSSNAALTTAEDTTLVLALSNFGSFSDVEGSTLASVQLTTLPSAGSVEYDNAGTWQAVSANQVISSADISAGKLRFTPAADASGVGYAALGFKVSDGTDLSAAAYALTMDVTPVNDAPVAVADALAATEDASVTYTAAQLVGNDSDIDGDTLTIASVTSGTGGSVVLNADGTVSFTPNADFNGAASFSYAVSDGSATSAPGTVTVYVAAVNDPPTSTDDIAVTTEDHRIILSLSDFGAYSDVEGSPLAEVQITSLPTAGRLALDNNGVGSVVTLNQVITAADILAGRLRFTPDSNESGTPYVEIRFKVGDGTAFSAQYSLTINVLEVNDVPVSTDDIVSTNEDTPVVLAISDFGGYSDVEGSALASVQITTLPLAGGLEYNNAGAWQGVTVNQVVSAADVTAGKLRYTPAMDANGPAHATIGFKVSDGSSFSAAAYTLTIDVTPVNDAPLAAADTLAAAEDASVTYTAAQLLGNDTDAESDTLAIDSVTSGTGGTVVLNGDGSVSFTPYANFNGAASFSYTATDGSATSAPASVLVYVTAMNDTPAAMADALATSEDTSATYSAAQLLGNDTDIDGDALTIASVTGGTGGSVVLNADGTVSFTPDADFNGTASFSYTATDGSATSTPATVTVNVTAVNDTPVAAADTLAATEDTPVTYTAAQLLGNDTDIDGDPLTIAAVTSGAGGTVVLNADGTVSFTPDANFNGAASFTYTVTDGSATSAPATVTVNVAAVNDTPVAAADTLAATEDTSVTYTAAQLLGNDTDIDGDPLTIASVTSGAGGTVVLNADGTVSFTPDANFNGAASFGYSVTDGTVASAGTTVTINVAAVNDAPLSTDDHAVVLAGTVQLLTVNDFGSYGDVEGVPLASVQITALPGAGRLEYDAAGSWQPVGTNQVLSAADLAAGKLRYITDASAGGNGYATLGFRVSDGAMWSAAYALSFDVLATAPVDPLPGVPVLPAPVLNETPAPTGAAPAQSGTPAASVAPSIDEYLSNGHAASIEAALGTPLAQDGLVTLRASDTLGPADRVSGMRFNVREFKVGAQSDVADAMDPGWLTSSQVSTTQTFLLNDFSVSSKNPSFMESIDRLREAADEETRLEHMASAAAAVAGFSFSVGYVVWLVRGGILVTSLLSSLPAWRMLDPLPVLARISDDEEQEDAEETEAWPEREPAMFGAGWAT